MIFNSWAQIDIESLSDLQKACNATEDQFINIKFINLLTQKMMLISSKHGQKISSYAALFEP